MYARSNLYGREGILVALRVLDMCDNCHMAGNGRQAILEQRRQRVVLVRRMSLSAQYGQQYVANSRQRQAPVAIGTAAQVDDM